MKSEPVLVECVDARGRVQWRERLQLDGDRRRFTIGRSVSADVTLDDDHVAALHAAVEIAPDGQVLIRDLGSINGILFAGKRHCGATGAATAIEVGSRSFQLGRTHLRVRSAQETLPPEKPDHAQQASLLGHPLWLSAAGAAVVVAQSVYSSWLQAPRDLTSSIVSAIALTAVVMAGWVAFWALLSRVMRGEWRGLVHLAIAMCVSAAYIAVEGAIDIATFMLSLQSWAMPFGFLAVLAIGVSLYLHLVNASSLAPRRAAIVSVLLPALIGGGSYWLMERSQERNVNRIDADVRLYPPALRLRAAESADSYFKSVATLRDAADRRRQAVAAQDSDLDQN